MTRAALAALLPLLVAVAGCSSPPDPTFRASATAPVVFLGYDYAGATAQPGTGRIDIVANPDTEEGTMVATFEVAGQAWRVEATRFAEAPGRAFQQGGVRSEFQEHGASGNGDAALPEIHALNAGWGQGTVSVGGQPFVDPLTGNTTFNVHYMATDTGPRDPDTYALTKADGTTPYDPATPGDVRLLNGTRQILLNVQSTAPLPPPDNTTTFTGTVSPQFTASHPLVVAQQARLLVAISLSNPTPLPSVGRVAFVLTGPDGAEAGRYAYDPSAAPGAPGQGAIDLPAAAPGDYSLDVSGDGVQVTYTATASVDYPEGVFVHVVYTEPA